MKVNHRVIHVLVLLLILVFSDCFKKGDEDPLVSLRTRKARMTGEWKIKSAEISYSYSYNVLSKNIKISNGFLTVEQSWYDSWTDSIHHGITDPFEYQEIWNFGKNDTFTFNVQFDSTINLNGKGTWNFTQNINHKTNNNEQLVLTFPIIGNSYSHPQWSMLFDYLYELPAYENNFIFDIQSLSNKEVTLRRTHYSLINDFEFYYNASITFSKR